MKLRNCLLVIVAVLLVDQISKIYVKTHFTYGEAVALFSWAKILFIENEGAAWGAKLSDVLPMSDSVSKLVLTVFRLFAIVGIGYWLWDIVKKNSSKTLAVAVSLIFAGALGNILDSVFYGVIFNESTRTEVATLFASDPYGTLFHGRVVDMLHFPFIENAVWPQWVPFVGGHTFSFFEPVFNVADTAISTGVGILIVFNKRIFGKTEQEETTVSATAEDQN